MNTLLQDLRYAVRMLLKHRFTTFITILILALSVGVNSAVFSVVNAVLLRPLSFKDPDNLVRVWESSPPPGTPRSAVAYKNFLDWKEQSRSFQSLSALWYQPMNLSGGEEPVQVWCSLVSGDFFKTLGVEAFKGRTFLPEEDQVNSDPTVVISYQLWQHYFGANPNAIGQRLNLNGNSFTIIGVMPPGYSYPQQTEVWFPINLVAERLQNRSMHNLAVIARLKPGVSVATAQVEMNTIAQQLARQYPETNTGQGVRLVRLQDSMVEDVRPALLLLLAAVLFVLLIACANVAIITLVRSLSRRKEFAMRVVMGARRGRIIRQLLTESVLFSLVAGALGLLLAYWSIEVIVGAIPESLVQFRQLTLDARVLGFTLFVSILTGILSGLAPALQISKPNVNEVLKEAERGSTSSRYLQRSIGLLAMAEIALTFTLMVGAGLMIKSFIRLLQTDSGIKPENLLTVQVSLPGAKYPDDHTRINFFNRVAERISSLPGVQAVGAINYLPFGTAYGTAWLNIEGRPAPASQSPPEVSFRVVTPDYFRAVGVPLLAGRVFTERDTTDSQAVVIVSKEMARRYWPGEDPLGKKIRLGEERPDNPWLTVVGIVGDVKNYGLATDIQPEAYTSYFQDPWRTMSLVIRSTENPTGLAASVRKEVKAIDPDQPVFNVKTMEQALSDSILLRRYGMLLIGIFAGLSLLIAALSIYSLIAYTVNLRIHEIGVRVALGAQQRDVLRLFMKRGLQVVIVGLLAGGIAAFLLGRVASSLVYGVSGSDPTTFLLMALLLLCVTGAASYLPARKATKVDPLKALRHD